MLTSMDNRIGRGSRGERGQVMIWVALFFVVFLAVIAIVVDVGFWLSDRRDAQNDADAMALAAAQELPNTLAATDIVYEWAALNNVSADEVEKIEFEDGNGNLCSSCNASLVRVFVTRDSEIFMSQVFGILDAQVAVKAAAVIKPLSGVCPFPWAIEGDPAGSASNFWGLTPGQELFVFQESGQSGFETPGNFGALAVLGSGDRIYRDTISGAACSGAGEGCATDDSNVCYDTLCGSDANLQLSENETLSCSTQTGALGSTTLKALVERYYPDADDECDAPSYSTAGALYKNVEVCEDRLGGMFIIDSFPDSGSSEDVQVLGIAWFYISGWDRWGGTGDGETGAPPPYDGIPDLGYVWGYLTDVTAADIWDLEGIVNPFAPVVGVLVE